MHPEVKQLARKSSWLSSFGPSSFGPSSGSPSTSSTCTSMFELAMLAASNFSTLSRGSTGEKAHFKPMFSAL
ncbi:unnamed protein product [Cuscuta campestris]|uniref:Uncharacterized protein n=1 Tax=Cuscuta campestris TaxID=132261 RepID=A0A484NJ00_9ASTE|nr:unnamed protein product [Cuscuta campestris]